MKHEVRKYKMSDTKLVELALNVKRSAIRDLNELGELGISPNTLNELQCAIYNFTEKPTDAELSTEVVTAMQQKNSEKAYFLKQIKQISERAKVKYGDFENFIDYPSKEGKYDGAVLKTLEHEPLPELTTEGISEEMFEKLSCRNNNFQAHAFNYCDMAIDDRIYSGNILYGMILNLASKGKQYWADRSENKLNDYKVSEKYINHWQCTDGKIGPYIVVNLSVTPVHEATVFTLANTGSVPLNFYFAVNPTDTIGESPVTLLPGISQTFTSLALGFNHKNGNTCLNILNNKALPGNYLVEWV